MINPTMKKRATSVRIFHQLNADLLEKQPKNIPTTKKFEAMVQAVRDTRIKRNNDKNERKHNDQERAVKKNRLFQRVAQSPALASNTALLKSKRSQSL